MIYSKVMTLLIICVTCIGTKNKKHLEFNAKKMVIYPISFGLYNPQNEAFRLFRTNRIIS